MKGKKMYKERKIYLYKLREKKKCEAIRSKKRKNRVYSLIRRMYDLYKGDIKFIIMDQDRFNMACYSKIHIFPPILNYTEWEQVIIRFKED